jgi:glycosyltransferase involved in cell wall biosynthesis
LLFAVRKAFTVQVCQPFLNVLNRNTRVDGEVCNRTAHQAKEAPASLKVLVIALNFPPDGEVGAKRVAGFCRYLPEFGIQPIVLTVEERFYKVQDETVPIPHVPVVRTSFANPLDWYRGLRVHLRRNRKVSVAQDEVPAAVTKSSFLRRQILALLEVPDEYWGWYFPAVRAAEKLIRAGSIAAIVSSGPPWTAHLVARHLKKKYRIPWLADFRDAWTFDCWRAGPGWRDSIDRRLEASCLRRADLVMSTTDAIRDAFLHAYPCLPASKFSTLTNGFDTSAFMTTTPRRADDSPILLVHTGKLYAHRRIDGFCKALQDLVSTGKLTPNDFRVLFIGDTDDSLLAGARQVARVLIENGSIQFVRRMPWQNTREILERAAVLLVFQGNQRLAIPAKFFDYLGTGKPILAVVEEGALTDILQATGSGLWAEPADSVGIAEKLLATLTLPPRSAGEQASLARRYHYRSLTEQLAAQIRIALFACKQSNGQSQQRQSEIPNEHCPS